MKVLDHLIHRMPALAGCRRDIQSGFDMLLNAVTNARKLLVCGNGGSAADAEHIAGELLKGFRNGRKLNAADAQRFKTFFPDDGETLVKGLQYSVPTIALTGHPGFSTAHLNDVDPYAIFSQQVFGLGRPGDVLWAISTSGNSRNVVNACKVAKVQGLKVLGLTGHKPNQISALADVCIRVPEQETYLVQELHLPVYHCLCEMLEESLFGENFPVATVNGAPLRKMEDGKRSLFRPKLLVFDFDGVFTDNKVMVSQEGVEHVLCDRSDGLGINFLQKAGVPMLVLSKEPNPVVRRRAEKLKLEVVHQCDDKRAFLTNHAREKGIDLKDVIYVGNDLNDEEAMRSVGLAVCPSDAHPSIRSLSHLVLSRPGGRGAIRELADLLVNL